jgi:hypothetical protein
VKRRLHRLWRRAVYCRRGQHRETAEMTGGSLLQLRCVDCGLPTPLGWVVRGSNKLHTHFPWERDDA